MEELNSRNRRNTMHTTRFNHITKRSIILKIDLMRFRSKLFFKFCSTKYDKIWLWAIKDEIPRNYCVNNRLVPLKHIKKGDHQTWRFCFRCVNHLLYRLHVPKYPCSIRKMLKMLSNYLFIVECFLSVFCFLNFVFFCVKNSGKS